MSVIITIISTLAANSAITAKVGNNIYPVAVPQSVQSPSIVVAITGNDPSETNQGASRLDMLMFDVYVEGKTYADVDQLSELARTTLEALKTTTIQSIRYRTENDQQFSSELGLFARVVTFSVRRQR